MDILTLFVVVPALTVIALMFSKGIKQHRVVAAIGGGVQAIMAFHLLWKFLQDRAAGAADIMLYKLIICGSNHLTSTTLSE